jgi:hypothetical protein
LRRALSQRTPHYCTQAKRNEGRNTQHTYAACRRIKADLKSPAAQGEEGKMTETSAITYVGGRLTGLSVLDVTAQQVAQALRLFVVQHFGATEVQSVITEPLEEDLDPGEIPLTASFDIMLPGEETCSVIVSMT